MSVRMGGRDRTAKTGSSRFERQDPRDAGLAPAAPSGGLRSRRAMPRSGRSTGEPAASGWRGGSSSRRRQPARSPSPAPPPASSKRPCSHNCFDSKAPGFGFQFGQGRCVMREGFGHGTFLACSFWFDTRPGETAVAPASPSMSSVPRAGTPVPLVCSCLDDIQASSRCLTLSITLSQSPGAGWRTVAPLDTKDCRRDLPASASSRRTGTESTPACPAPRPDAPPRCRPR